MDANQVGYVHEPTFEDTKAILDRAVSFKPKRQIIILFSGGEPTLSPYFLEAVSYARKVDSTEFWQRRTGYVTPKTSSFVKPLKRRPARCIPAVRRRQRRKEQTRGVGNLFDVKLRAIENLASVGIKVTLVTTIVNTINNDASSDRGIRGEEHRQSSDYCVPACFVYGSR